jgi:acetyl esterase
MNPSIPIFSSLLLGVALLLPSDAAEIAPNRSVTYKSVSGVDLKLDVFQPAGLKPTDQRPAIVFFFGGGWMGGSTKQFYAQAQAMAAQGMVAFSADYRVKSRQGTTPFESVMDAKSAIRWVREHAAELGINPSRIVASGGSAGGHLAACTGLIEGNEEEGEKLAISSKPNALILFNPVLDTTAKGYGAHAFPPERQTELSPCHHVRKGIVPTLLFHGTADKTVPFENAERFTQLMRESGNECGLVPFKDKDHGFFNGSFFRPSNGNADYERTMSLSVEFLKAHGLLWVQ